MHHRSHIMTFCALPLALLGACKSTPGAQPTDMSRAAHEAEAKHHEQLAEAEEARFDPTQAEGDVFFDDGTNLTPARFGHYNPTAVHLQAAAEHRKHAEDHARAAKALASFEEGQCKHFAPNKRALCPLLGTIASSQDTADGVRLTLKPEADGAVITAHILCHLAYAQSAGRQGMDECPLYLPNVQVRQVQPNEIVLRTDPDGVEALQQRVHSHVSP